LRKNKTADEFARDSEHREGTTENREESSLNRDSMNKIGESAEIIWD
jgi:hypothetical protein